MEAASVPVWQSSREISARGFPPINRRELDAVRTLSGVGTVRGGVGSGLGVGWLGEGTLPSGGGLVGQEIYLPTYSNNAVRANTNKLRYVMSRYVYEAFRPVTMP